MREESSSEDEEKGEESDEDPGEVLPLQGGPPPSDSDITESASDGVCGACLACICTCARGSLLGNLM